MTQTLIGFVRQNDYCCPLSPGYNLIAAGYPLVQTPQDRAMTWSGLDFNGFTGGVEVSHADNVIFWKGDTDIGLECYTSYWLVDAGIDPYRRWALAGDSSIISQDTTPLFQPNRAAFYDSISGNPNYCMPAGWIP